MKRAAITCLSLTGCLFELRSGIVDHVDKTSEVAYTAGFNEIQERSEAATCEEAEAALAQFKYSKDKMAKMVIDMEGRLRAGEAEEAKKGLALKISLEEAQADGLCTLAARFIGRCVARSSWTNTATW